jgi:hypothetical protein
MSREASLDYEAREKTLLASAGRMSKEALLEGRACSDDDGGLVA